jgi:hypothetical protein
MHVGKIPAGSLQTSCGEGTTNTYLFLGAFRISERVVHVAVVPGLPLVTCLKEDFLSIIAIESVYFIALISMRKKTKTTTIAGP